MESKWNLSSLIHVKNLIQSRRIIDFKFSLPDGSLLTDPPNAMLYTSTKEFCYARLQEYPSSRPPKARTVVIEFTYLRIFIRWMVANKIYGYSQLCPHHVEIQFLSFLRGNSEDGEEDNKARSEEKVATILRIVQRLWEIREKMSESLTFNPFNGKLPSEVLGVNLSHGEENRTPIIPDEVMAPLGNAALDYVFLYSDDILNARAQLESVREKLDAQSRYECARGVRDNLTFSASHIGNHARAALMNVSISIKADTGERWREPFSRVMDLYREETLLFTACYIVVAWLTGMRDSEITSLQVSCLRRELSEDGIIERIKVQGTLFKGVSAPRGRPETWVTIEPVAKAIEVLTRLTEHLRARTEGEITELFVRGERRLTTSVLTADSIRQLLLNFAKHVNIPLVDGNEWKLSCRQFRRTLARWIGRRLFGELAGMIQYKHLQIATFEGYIGNDPEFNKDFAEEKLLANIDLLEVLKRDALEGKVAGPKAAEIIETFRGVAGDRRSDDERYLLRHLAKILYVGPYNLCFYDPAYAMCQQHVPIQERKSPITSHCQPDVCANSCIAKDQAGPHLTQLYEIRRLLKTPKLPVPQRIALEQEEARVGRIVEPLVGIPENN